MKPIPFQSDTHLPAIRLVILLHKENSMKPSQLTSFLLKAIVAKEPVLIVSAPGVGKTAIVEHACSVVNAHYIPRFPTIEDPTDSKGMPGFVDGEAMFVPFKDMKVLMNATELTCCFIDDLGQAVEAVQKPYMQLIHARKSNGYRVSDHVAFIAATNRHTDKAGVSGVLEPVKSRFVTIIKLEPDVEDWVSWALKVGLPTELIAFIRFRPELLFQFQPTKEIKNSPCPRTVHNVGKLMQMGIPTELEYEVYEGAAGEGFAAEFTGFLQIYRKLPNPDTVLMNPMKAEVPDDSATLYAISVAIARKASENNIDRVITYANRLPVEFNVLLMRDALGVSPEISSTRPYIQWLSDNSSVLI